MTPIQEPSIQLLLTAPEAARVLRISERKLWALTASGEVPHVRIGRSVRYSTSDFARWIESCTEGRR